MTLGMKFHSVSKKCLFTLLFIEGEMKCNLFFGIVGVQWPIKKMK